MERPPSAILERMEFLARTEINITPFGLRQKIYACPGHLVPLERFPLYLIVKIECKIKVLEYLCQL